MRRSPWIFIFVTIFLDLLGYGMVVPLLPFYVQSMAGGALLAGSLGSLYALMQLFSGPVLGALSDRVGRRPVLLGCLLGTALAFGLLGSAQSLGMLFLAVALDGVTGGNLTTAHAYIADMTRPEQRARALGIAGAALGLGLMAGPALGGLLSGSGLALPAYGAAGVALLNLLFGLRALPESLPPEKRALALEWGKLNPLAQLGGIGRLGADLGLLAAVFALNLSFAGLQTNFPLFSQARFGWDGLRNGIFFGFVGVCAVLTQGVLFQWAQRRAGERRLALGGLALLAAGLAGTALAPLDGLLYASVGLAALGSGLAIPALSGLISAQVPAAAQGRLMGGLQALLSLTAIGGPALAGVLFERVGTAAPYWMGALLAGLALWLAGRALQQRPQAA